MMRTRPFIRERFFRRRKRSPAGRMPTAQRSCSAFPAKTEWRKKEREAMAVAGRIRELVGKLSVTDGETKQLRPARYSDMVILLRSPSGWDETL